MSKRKAARATVEDLKAKIKAACGDDGWDELFHLVRDDLKVQFDFENYEFEGYRETPGGLAYAEFWAGGDWQHPVWFVVYWDGKRLRAYVPTEGNPYNTDTMRAYGDAGREEADLENARKRWPHLFEGRDGVEPDDFRFDHDEIGRDVRDRIAVE